MNGGDRGVTCTGDRVSVMGKAQPPMALQPWCLLHTLRDAVSQCHAELGGSKVTATLSATWVG